MILSRNASNERGYAALLCAIVLSAILLGLTAGAASSGYFARFDILSAHAKAQAQALAQTCVDLAIAGLSQNPSPAYFKPQRISLAAGDCAINITGTGTSRVITASADYLQTFTELEVTVSLDSSAEGSARITINSWRELP
jgi:hypothetical protein